MQLGEKTVGIDGDVHGLGLVRDGIGPWVQNF
jgi:hypothetical protein